MYTLIYFKDGHKKEVNKNTMRQITKAIEKLPALTAYYVEDENGAEVMTAQETPYKGEDHGSKKSAKSNRGNGAVQKTDELVDKQAPSTPKAGDDNRGQSGDTTIHEDSKGGK